jgi:Pyruvate/2-oxoacid:ferredoxin oxidoreductase delta subunit
MNDRPWEHEPDHALFMSEAGYICEIKRNPYHGSLLGYIYIPAAHPLSGMTDDGINGWPNRDEAAIPVHGGWTFCEPTKDYTKFGFDCAHAGDYCPEMAVRAKAYGLASYQDTDDVYRDFNYVRGQLERAAKKFKELAQ